VQRSIAILQKTGKLYIAAYGLVNDEESNLQSQIIRFNHKRLNRLMKVKPALRFKQTYTGEAGAIKINTCLLHTLSKLN
jgi:hypothetical protein